MPTRRLTSAERRAAEANVLVRAAQSGDGRSFDTLVRRFRPRIFALALHLTGSPSDADDIAQEAFVQAYRRLEFFEGRSEFFTWLYRIAMNRGLNLKRDRGRHQPVTLDDPRVEAALRVDAPGCPRRALELRETYVQLIRALDELSPVLKGAVVLTTLQGLSHSEAAVVLGCKPSLVAWRLHEARKRLRESLDRAAERAIPPVPTRRVSRENLDRKVAPDLRTLPWERLGELMGAPG